MKGVLAASVLGIALGACDRDAPPPAAPLVVGSAVPSHEPPAPVDEPKPAPSPRRPLGFEDLGKACPLVPRIEDYQGIATCGAFGKVAAIEWRLADVVEEPEKAQITATREVVDRSVTEVLMITEDAAWIRVTRPTARVTGSTWMAIIGLLTDEQLVEAQRRAKLRTDVLFRTGSAWKEALIDSGPRPPPGP